MKWETMYTTTSKLDEKGRLLIKKEIRELIGVKKGSTVRLMVSDGKIIIEPLSSEKSTAKDYFGMVKVTNWPKDLDSFTTEVIQRWQREADIDDDT